MPMYLMEAPLQWLNDFWNNVKQNKKIISASNHSHTRMRAGIRLINGPHAPFLKTDCNDMVRLIKLFFFHLPTLWKVDSFVNMFLSYLQREHVSRARIASSQRSLPPFGYTGDRQKKVRVVRHLEVALLVRIEIVLGSGLNAGGAFTDSVSTGRRRRRRRCEKLPTVNISLMHCLIVMTRQFSTKTNRVNR